MKKVMILGLMLSWLSCKTLSGESSISTSHRPDSRLTVPLLKEMGKRVDLLMEES
jgi:hypothetical protein